MANWANPVITTQYDVFVNEAKDRDVDCANMFMNAPTNPPVGSIQFARMGGPLFIFREHNGSAFDNRILAVAGGGTGAGEPGTARVNLGIGTMGVQNSNAVNISGGSALFNTFTLSCTLGFSASNAYDIGTNAAKARRGYFGDALVIPVGVDKYATS